MRLTLRPGTDEVARADADLLSAMGLPGGGVVRLGRTHALVSPGVMSSPMELTVPAEVMANSGLAAGSSVDVVRAKLPAAIRVVLGGDRLAADARHLARSLHGRAVTGAGPAEPEVADALAPGLPPGVVLTQRADRLYLHLFAWPFGHLHLRGIGDRVRYAQLLHDGSEVRGSRSDPEQKAWNTVPGGQPPGTLTLHLPTVRPDVAVPVVEVFLDPAR